MPSPISSRSWGIGCDKDVESGLEGSQDRVSRPVQKLGHSAEAIWFEMPVL
jgi:hypothetical protein